MNKATLLLSLLCVSGSALAEFRGEFKPVDRFSRHRELGERSRRTHEKMNICSEIEQNLINAEQVYENYADEISSVNRAITNQRQNVNRKASALRTKQQKFARDNKTYSQLTSRQKNKAKLIKKNTKAKNDANVLIPAAETVYNDAKKLKKKKCDRGFGFGGLSHSCKKAKKALKRAADIFNPLVTKRDTAIANLKELSQIDGKVARAKRALNASTLANTNEINAKPTLSKMQKKLQNMVSKRDQDNSDFQEVENLYGRLGVRFEKCTTMRYEAKKAPAFRRALSVFAANNGDGCDEINAELMNAGRRGNGGEFARIAKQDGINEAYELICKSDELLRIQEVEVPGATIEVPGQCSNDEGIFIQDFFSTNENGSPKYEKNMSKSYTFRKAGVSQINLKISNIDLEIGWDFLYVYNAAGEEIAKISNEEKEVPFGDYETGFIDGDNITIKVTSDKATQNTGFSIDGFFVKK